MMVEDYNPNPDVRNPKNGIFIGNNKIMKKLLSFIFPQWVSETWRPNSMGAADKRNYWGMCIAGTVIWLLIYGMMYFKLFDTYLYLYYVRADWGFHLVSWIAAVGSIISIWKAPDAESGGLTGQAYSYLIFGLLLAAILFGAGFNFDLRGIEI